MSLVKKHIAQIRAAEKKLEVAASKAVRDNEAFILSTLKHDQLGEGKDSFGKEVGTYAPSTEEVFAKKRPLPRTAKTFGQPYTFEWTGKFFDTMKVKTSREGFDITSARKSELEGIYGTPLTKLTEENMDFVSEKVIKPALYELVLDAIVKF